MSLRMGSEVSKAHSIPAGSLCLLLAQVLTHCSNDMPACLPAAMLATMVVVDSPTETVSKPQLNAFFCQLPWSQCLFTATESN